MKTIRNVSLAAAVIMMGIGLWLRSGSAKEDPKERLKLKLKKPDIIDIKRVAVNNWNYVIRNQGSYMYDSPDSDHDLNTAGGEFPRGSGITIVYAGGIFIGTLKNGVPVVSQSAFNVEFQPGRILNSGVPFIELTAEDPASPDLRVYCIDRSRSGADYASWPADAPKDALGQPALIADAQTWAVFNDLNTALSTESVQVSPDPGLGMQVILESFAFNAGALSDIVYLKFTIENKTATNYPNSYLGMWMDPDVANPGNDVVGVDTAKGLGFIYNFTESDAHECVGFDFFQGPVVDTSDIGASLAAKFSANDRVLNYDSISGTYKSVQLPPGKLWLGATSFNTWLYGKDPHTNLERYNLLKGLNTDGRAKNGTGFDDYYAFRGNPLVLPSSDPNIDHFPYDKRVLHGVGPFTIKAGSSQEIWVGVIGGLGTSRLNAVANMFTTDDVAQKTFNAGLIAPTAPEVPKIRVAPLDGKVVVMWENNAEFKPDIAGRILGITTANGYTANYDSTDFQGYRVYRSRTGLPGSYTMLAQYDLADGFTFVRNKFVNSAGRLQVEDITFGEDSGLNYMFTDTDVINGQLYFYSVAAYDAQPYIANTKINFDDPDFGTLSMPSGLPISLESAQMANVVSVVPQSQMADINSAAAGSVIHLNGVSDGVVETELIDPEAVTGHEYRIEFFKIPDSISHAPVRGLTSVKLAYRVLDITTSSIAGFSNRVDDPQTYVDKNFNGRYDAGVDSVYNEKYFHTRIAKVGDTGHDGLFGIADGVLVKIYQYDYFKSVQYIPGPQFTALGFTKPWWDGIGAAGGGANMGVSNPNQTIAGIFGGGPLRNADGTNLAANAISASNKDIQIIFSRDSTKWSYAYATTGGTGQFVNYCRIPFKAFEIDKTDGDSTPRQINVAFRNSNYNTALFSGLWSLLNGYGVGPEIRGVMGFDTSTYDLDNKTGGKGATLGTDHLNPYTQYGVGTANYAGFLTYYRDSEGDESGKGAYDGLAYVDSINKVLGYDSTGDFYNIDVIEQGLQGFLYRAIPDEGTLTARVNHPILTSDFYTFSTTPNSHITSKKELKKSLKNIKVVPNPYYGRSAYQDQAFEKIIKFTHLPGACTIKIFTVSGDLVRTIRHNAASVNDRINTDPLTLSYDPLPKETSIEYWDLKNSKGRFIASGMYIALIEAPEIGKTTVKFAVIQEAHIVTDDQNN